MKILPKNNMIFVQRREADQKSEGGIVLTGSAKTPINDGMITHVSDGIGGQAPQYKVGQKVIFGEYAGAPVVIEGVSYLAMLETDIIAVLEDDNPDNGMLT